ncbi:hypothetical protein FHS01_002928 [Longimicrobium terrae]|uniref:Uncharacterized protein n=1 Tax=Longimicrobium terrae TaxID=1639882 RepID=A0A841GZD9_9BACT|nr:hypothetical protein [Longimicrobium terrae]MBB6071094.1 hypothetical protein [Longimicrobium terrae]
MTTMRSKTCRPLMLALATAGVLAGMGGSARLAYAQEVKCYLMVCTGSVCGATQIPCPPPPGEETPKLPPTGNP